MVFFDVLLEFMLEVIDIFVLCLVIELLVVNVFAKLDVFE